MRTHSKQTRSESCSSKDAVRLLYLDSNAEYSEEISSECGRQLLNYAPNTTEPGDLSAQKSWNEGALPGLHSSDEPYVMNVKKEGDIDKDSYFVD